jgi:hypothetical protein
MGRRLHDRLVVKQLEADSAAGRSALAGHELQLDEYAAWLSRRCTLGGYPELARQGALRGGDTAGQVRSGASHGPEPTGAVGADTVQLGGDATGSGGMFRTTGSPSAPSASIQRPSTQTRSRTSDRRVRVLRERKGYPPPARSRPHRGGIHDLSTQSGVKMLPPAAQTEVLERIRRRVEAHGGTVILHHLAALTLAERVA